MEINKQLFEDILSGRLTGKFTLRNGEICSSTDLHRNNHYSTATHPYMLGIKTYTSMGFYSYCGTSRFDIINFIPDTNMKENELTIEIPEGQEIDWQESAKQEKIVFKKKNPKPRSWEEYCKYHRNELHFVSGYDVVGGYSRRQGIYESGYCTVPSKELAEAFITMMQLMSLRHDWIHKWSVDNGLTDDWEPDWSSTAPCKYCIYGIYDDRVTVKASQQFKYPLSFPTRELAEDFMDTFKDLLEIAKPLI